MKLAVVTPVGPGHENFVALAAVSVVAAGRGRFDEVWHEIVWDLKGLLGRGKARNIGVSRHPDADWYFFLDADDRMRPDAMELNDFDAEATFGAICLNGAVTSSNVYPCGFYEVCMYGATGTLSMGFFVRGEVGRRLKWNAELDIGEDFEFYMRLPSFTKRVRPLVDIGGALPSAGGPRGYQGNIHWTDKCNEQIRAAQERKPEKYDLRGRSILAKAQPSRRKRDEVPDAVRG
jgi:hypothetical protein